MNNPLDRRPKLIALYFPQLHAIPENDAWWGQGFTDWVNVGRAKRLYRGHHQPRVPAGLGVYDQSREDVIRHQIDLAKAHGIYGFSHYHYWFDGKQLLETPTNRFLAARDIDFRFCLNWANETWSRRWDGQDHHILQLQTHPPEKERWELHFQYLIKAWTDPRAICIDGKPLFLIYRPLRIPQLGDMLDYWRTRAHAYGLPGLYFATVQQFHRPPSEVLRHFDALMLFQPFASMANTGPMRVARWRKALQQLPYALPRAMPKLLHRALVEHTPLSPLVERLTQPVFYDYQRVWRDIISRRDPPGTTIFPGAFVDWDNTARYKRRATILLGASPERFEFWLRRLLGAVTENRPEERLVFINAWNEWAEGAYLEPDERYGLRYLQAVKRAQE